MSDQRFNNLMKWLETFELEAPHTTITDISDGVALAEALTQIAPEWFTVAWKSKIKVNVGNNWRLKVSNLKKIIEAVIEYYVECLNQQLLGFAKPDATKIGEHCDHRELGRLLQLVLGCAVNCDQKQQYITRIMGMEEAVQQAIMQSIQELEDCMHGPRLSLGASLIDPGESGQQRLLSELQTTVDSRDQLAQRCHELDQQLSFLQEEKSGLLGENKKLLQRLEEFENPDESGTSLKYTGLRKQVEALKDEIFKIETSRDDYRVRNEVLEEKLLELQSRQEDLQKSAAEAHHLKDEVDALRETADKATKYEQVIESYKKKLEDMSDLKRQMKILEDKNTECLQYKIDLEEEQKRTALLRNHLELCKQQLAEAHLKLDESTNKCDKLEFEAKKTEAKLSSLQRERDRLAVERDALKETNEELRCSQLQAAGNASRPSDDADSNTTNTNLLPLDIKEKILSLQHENKMLKLKQQGTEEKLPTVQALLDDSEVRVNTLREQNRKSNQRIMELENKLEELTGISAKESKSDSSSYQQKIVQLEEELARIQSEKESLSSQVEERDSLVQTHKQKVFTLQENLNRREYEIAALEERYKRYVEKSKSVIKSLEPKQSNGSPSEVTMLRNQLIEKHKIIESLERTLKETRLLKEMEEKLMTSAYYRLGLSCHREAVDQRLASQNAGQGQSFLARQRQPSARRSHNNPPYNSK